jgi:hypothetical protein
MDIEFFKKGGKAKKKKTKQTTKIKQDVNIKNIINVTRPRVYPKSTGTQGQTRTKEQAFNNYLRMFTPPSNSFKSVSISNPATTSDNVTALQQQTETIINGKVKQQVKEAIDKIELDRVNNLLQMDFNVPLSNIPSRPQTVINYPASIQSGDYPPSEGDAPSISGSVSEIPRIFNPSIASSIKSGDYPPSIYSNVSNITGASSASKIDPIFHFAPSISSSDASNVSNQRRIPPRDQGQRQIIDSQILQPPREEKEREVKEREILPPREEKEREEKSQFIHNLPSESELLKKDYEELKALAQKNNIKLPAGKSKPQIVFNLINNVQKGIKGKRGPKK